MVKEYKKYGIKVYYRTGDSFHSENTDRILELQWNDLDIAKLNLKRIKEHYLWYEWLHNGSRWGHKEVSEPEWHKPYNDNKYGSEYTLILKADNENDMQIYAFWCGYFEELHSADIINIEKKDNDLHIEI